MCPLPGEEDAMMEEAMKKMELIKHKMKRAAPQEDQGSTYPDHGGS